MSISDEIRNDADQAVAGGRGFRRPCAGLPAGPTEDHRVAFALHDVVMAIRGARDEGATREEVERVVCSLYGVPKVAP